MDWCTPLREVWSDELWCAALECELPFLFVLQLIVLLIFQPCVLNTYHETYVGRNPAPSHRISCMHIQASNQGRVWVLSAIRHLQVTVNGSSQNQITRYRRVVIHA